jgi:hypothetical protein
VVRWLWWLWWLTVNSTALVVVVVVAPPSECVGGKKEGRGKMGIVGPGIAGYSRLYVD